MATRPSASIPVVIELDERGILIGSCLLPLKSGIKNRTIFQRFEDRHILFGSEAEETKAVTEKAMTSQSSKRKSLVNLAARTTVV